MATSILSSPLPFYSSYQLQRRHRQCDAQCRQKTNRKHVTTIAVTTRRRRGAKTGCASLCVAAAAAAARNRNPTLKMHQKLEMMSSNDDDCGSEHRFFNRMVLQLRFSRLCALERCRFSVSGVLRSRVNSSSSSSSSRASSSSRLQPRFQRRTTTHLWFIDLAEFWGFLGSGGGGDDGAAAAAAASDPSGLLSRPDRSVSSAAKEYNNKVETEDKRIAGEQEEQIVEGIALEQEEGIVVEEEEEGERGLQDLDASSIQETAAPTSATSSAVEVPTEDSLGANLRKQQEEEEEEVAVASVISSQSAASRQQQQEGGSENSAVVAGLEDERFLRRVAMAADADAALAMIAERAGDHSGISGIVSNQYCSDLMIAALAEGNGELAFSILEAMRSSIIQRRVNDREEGWRWAQPNVSTYAALVKGLAASLCVADAIQMVANVRRRGIPAGDEVPFGKVVTCPTCKTTLAVVQPQQGVQVVPCAKCRYQYELWSGTVTSCDSESISMNISAFERGLRALQLLKRPIPAAVHSIVVSAPNGVARTLRCATESADIPAQEGERVTVASAAPANAGFGIGPLKVNARSPGWRPSEPMAITNHVTSRVGSLLRPPPKAGSGAAFDSSFIIPAAILLVSSDAATALIDPTLPRAIAIGAAVAIGLGGAANAFVLPRLNQLPERTADAMALRQQLLAQHELLQTRLQDLSQAAADDVRMLARMCQLQNKMEAVGEPAYSARIERVQKAREGLDERLVARLELIDSYAKIASMIEIEVEMDVDVLAAEGARTSESIADQIERLMDVEDLQMAWKIQAEANDELERLLQSSPLLPEST
ncbi:unnamed protein product [Sphagnum jensenii]|uniref:Uncharacterized protein n=1 Tax=Sphagnum jensenii TaxID=128206 RepID=A0ABP1A9N3_9BRYO